MPYLTEQRKYEIDEGDTPATPGELNYKITETCLAYLDTLPEVKYADFNTVVGALEAAKLEFYRRAVTPYEEEKIKENGDVY